MSEMVSESVKPVVYVFGNNLDGQAGAAIGEEQITLPTSIEDAAGRSDNHFDSGRVARIVCNQKQSFVLTNDGTLLTAGANENYELGRSGKRSLLSRVDALEAFRVCDVTLGSNFAIAVLQDGRCVSWGANDLGQLGLGTERGGSGQRESRSRPKLAAIMSDVGGIVQISAGAQHCVALARSGAVYSWGGNRQGQLGDGQINSCPIPREVSQLRHRPVVSVACGEAHTLVMTVGGNVYCWGENSQGQLGLEDTTRRLRPELIRSLRASRVCRVTAGRAHSAVISPSGLVFTFGSDFFGQLGHGRTADSSTPKFSATPQVVEKLRPNDANCRPLEVACGAASTLVLLADGRVFSFGCSTSGQLGLGNKLNVSVPSHVVLPAGEKAVNVACGPMSLTSFVITRGVELHRVPLPSVDLDSISAAVHRLRDAGASQKTAALNSLREMVSRAFSSIAVLNCSFRVAQGSGGGLNLKLSDIRRAYDLLMNTQHDEVVATLGRALMHMTEKLREVPTDFPENLHCFLICLENPLLLKPSQSYIALERIVSGILALPRICRQQLFGWLKGYSSEYFARVVQVVQLYLSFGFSNSANNIDASPAVLVLEILWEINGGDVHTGMKITSRGTSDGGYSSGSRIIPDTYFVNADVLKSINLADERRKFLQSKQENQNTKVFNFLNYPFLLNIETKAKFLRTDFSEKMQMIAYRIASSLNSIDQNVEASHYNIRFDTITRQINPNSVIPKGLDISLSDSFVENVVIDFQRKAAAGQLGNVMANAVPISVPAYSLGLNLQVRRENMLHDLLSEIEAIAGAAKTQGVDPRDVLFLPLRATFVGEFGVDAGGVSREMLTLSIKELLEKYRVLAPMQNGQLVWFANDNFSRAERAERCARVRANGNGVDTSVEQQINAIFDACAAGDSRAHSENGADEHRERPARFAHKLSALFYPPQEDVAECAYDFEAEFALGLLYGFASYNNCLIDIPLPKALYKVLLKVDSLERNKDMAFDIHQKLDIEDILTLSDLWECDEDIARSMQQLLDYEDGDLADVFGIDFTASTNPLLPDRLGSERKYVDLVANGDLKSVDRSNRAVFVELYLQHTLFQSVSSAALAFFRGLQVFFFSTKPSVMAGRKALPIPVFSYHMCSAPEMQQLLCGSDDVGDISELRMHTTYRGEFTDEHPVVNFLWSVLCELPVADIRRFLTFVTGSDRTPVGGMKEMSMTVQSTRPSTSNALPAAHTCFNILDLPATYESREMLKDRLMFALDNATGFGLI